MFQSAITNAVRTYGRDDDYSFSSPPTKHSSISFSNISAALSNSPVVDTLRRGSASLVGLLQSRSCFDMNGQNPRQSAVPFGYVFPPEGSQTSEPLLNLQENGFLASFYSQQHQTHSQPHVHPHTHVLSHSPTITYPGINHVDDNRGITNNFSWLMHEPPPTIHDISTASISPAVMNQQHHSLSPHLDMSELNMSMSMHDDIMGAAALLTQPLQTPTHTSLQSIQDHQSISPTFQLQRAQPQSILSQHLFSSPAVQEPHASLVLEPVHTDDALAGISTSTTMENMHATQQSTLMSALIPRINTSPTTLSSVPMSSVPQTAPPLNRPDQPPNPRLYHFGSDSHFDSNGFRPSSDFERHDYRAELLSSELRRLKPINRTPEISREASPSLIKRLKTEADTDINPSHLTHKRKRSDQTDDSLVDDDDDDDEEAAIRGGIKRNRRASAPGSSRSKRENLTDQQKRQNHIASEQKRRAQIKQGFDELNRIVPELRESGLSKSGVLLEACNFLDIVKQMNEKLIGRLGFSAMI